MLQRTALGWWVDASVEGLTQGLAKRQCRRDSLQADIILATSNKQTFGRRVKKRSGNPAWEHR